MGWTSVAMDTALADIVSMETKNTFPAARCSPPPLGSSMDRNPDSSPTVAVQMCSSRRGDADAVMGASRSGRRAKAAVVHDLAVEEGNLPAGPLGEARVVRDHHDGAALAVEGVEQVHDQVGVLRVEVAR